MKIIRGLIKILFVVLLVVWTICFFYTWVYLGHSPLDFDRSSRIALLEFGLCDGLEPDSSEPIWINDPILSEQDFVQICGLLESETRSIFAVYAYHEQEQHSYHYGTIEGLSEGYFSYTLPFFPEGPEGQYFVHFNLGRKTLGSMQFEVR